MMVRCGYGDRSRRRGLMAAVEERTRVAAAAVVAVVRIAVVERQRTPRRPIGIIQRIQVSGNREGIKDCAFDIQQFVTGYLFL